MAERVEVAAAGPRTLPPHPRPLKRKAGEFNELPRFKRGYGWADSKSSISPSLLDTLTAKPLPRPPSHLINDPVIQHALLKHADDIKVETPFDIDKFESLVIDHPNRPFVESVLMGLREGFWPLDDGEWKIELEEVTDNYPASPEDLEEIRKFRDKECGTDHWSGEISELLPGMKISPMFVVHQDGKARVVTDHSGSGVNAGIHRDDAKVVYDDMHSFGQTMRDAKAANPNCRLVVFKDDVASAFLNLPAHPIWQLRQVVSVDGKLYMVRRLVFGNRASPKIWCSVSGLMCWVAVEKLGIDGLKVYMDDPRAIH